MDERLFDDERHRNNHHIQLNNRNNNNSNLISISRRRHGDGQTASSTSRQLQGRRTTDADDEQELQRVQEVVRLENPRPEFIRNKNIYVDVNNVSASTSTTSTPTTTTVAVRAPVHRHQQNQIVGNHLHLNSVVAVLRKPIVNNTIISSTTTTNENNTGVSNRNNNEDEDNSLSAFFDVGRRPSSPTRTIKNIQQLQQQQRSRTSRSNERGGDLNKLSLSTSRQNHNNHNHHHPVNLRTLPPPRTTTMITTNQPTKNDSQNKKIQEPQLHNRRSGGAICRDCNKCQCRECMKPRELYCCKKWPVDDVVEMLTCCVCVKGCWYHFRLNGGKASHHRTASTDDDDYVDGYDEADRICCNCIPSTSTTNCAMKYSCLAVSALLLPCLWCYPLMKLGAWVCSKCYARCNDNGCRCNTNLNRRRRRFRSSNIDELMAMRRKNKDSIPADAVITTQPTSANKKIVQQLSTTALNQNNNNFSCNNNYNHGTPAERHLLFKYHQHPP